MAKKALMYSVCCSAVLSSLIVQASPTVAAPTQATVKANTLNVRSEPSTKGTIIGKIQKNTRVEIKNEKDGWSHVVYQGKAGWISSTYVQKQNVTSTTAPSQSTLASAVVNASTLNVRSTPSTNGPILTKLPRNTKVTILSIKGEWSQILTSSNQVGWVASQYVKGTSQAVQPATPSSSNTGSSLEVKVVTASSLNVRSSASTSGQVLTKVTRNTKVTVLSVKGEWSQVRTSNNQVGWVANQYLASTNSQPTQPALPVPNPESEEAKIVSASSLNVRSVPSTNGQILMSLLKNTEVHVLKVEGDWTRIKTKDNRIGWVASQYLIAKQTTSQPNEPSEQAKIAFVNASSLNVRAVPSINGNVLASLPNQTEVYVMKANGNWTQIKTKNNQIGWVASQYLTTSNPVVTPTPNPVSSPFLKGETIVLDAGHGGKDPGAVANGISEKDVTMGVIKHVQQMLLSAGVNVIMTRSNDTYPTLGGRVDVANKNKADLFISIHVNAGPPSAQGAETFYDSSRNPRSEEGKKLAEEIQRQLVSLVGMKDRKVKAAGFQVIKYTNMPSVLVELGFVTNASDAKKLATQQELYAQAIVNGIIMYYEKQ
ncbi:SH3 domain-containing protein [Metabacillus iocasae]|uniref:N-acetylmuramoyl-L-alanine amidase n=1 Tax=Priestia iocasae TaxID=2291674 RepID=A0ABS2QUN1_9BACI|nr:SH3 domain-containing protein [Metabacillus iocasae]MBM7702214.1 N-acetylmuramoyl-L-alanine amidase [Metabacillus iocasae]